MVTYRGAAHRSLAPTVELRAKGLGLLVLAGGRGSSSLEYFGYAGGKSSLRTMRMHLATYGFGAGNAPLLGSVGGHCSLHCVGATASYVHSITCLAVPADPTCAEGHFSPRAGGRFPPRRGTLSPMPRDILPDKMMRLVFSGVARRPL